MNKRIRVPLEWHGGKYYLAPKIVALMPKHLHYVEPYFGGGSVLLARDPDDPNLSVDGKGVSEVVNDINGDLVRFWRVIRDPITFGEFTRQAQAMPTSRREWEATQLPSVYSETTVEHALEFFVRCRQSLAGRMESFTLITRTRTRRSMNGNVSEWLSAVDGLPEVHARLRRVLIENRPALDLIRSEDTRDTLFYIDPPYLHETRASKDVYAHEMTERDHSDLLSAIRVCQGKVMISGYPSPFYDRNLGGWNRHEFDIANNAAGGSAKRRMTECLWCNF